MKKKTKRHETDSRASQNGADPSHVKGGDEKEPKTAKQRRLHTTRIDLPEKVRVEVCQLLNQTLAECFDLYSQVKQAHWNVKGPNFYQLHLLFDEIAGELIEFVDEFAERITTLGGTAFGTVRMAADSSELPEYPVGALADMDHVIALSDRLAQFGARLREYIDECDELGDMDTADLFTGVSRDIDKRLWFLEAHLQGPAPAEAKQVHLDAIIGGKPGARR